MEKEPSEGDKEKEELREIRILHVASLLLGHKQKLLEHTSHLHPPPQRRSLIYVLVLHRFRTDSPPQSSIHHQGLNLFHLFSHFPLYLLRVRACCRGELAAEFEIDWISLPVFVVAVFQCWLVKHRGLMFGVLLVFDSGLGERCGDSSRSKVWGFERVAMVR
ncbi:hypothetical protein Droror1_Dr00016082 [Drosera rotundifolia]